MEIKRKVARQLERVVARNKLIRMGDDGEAFILYEKAIYKHHYKKEFRQTWWEPLIAQLVVDILHGVIQRAIVEIPPRHGKTERCVRLAASYGQGLDPQTSFMYSTYGDVLSKLTSAETKEVMESDIYNEIFKNVSFSNKLNTTTHWLLDEGGGLFATSVGAGGTGFPASIYIPDDLLKAIEADSLAARDKAWASFTGSGISRLEGKQQAVLMVGQKLHEDDVSGRVLELEGKVENGGKWYVLSLSVVNNFNEFYYWVKQSKKKGYPSATDEHIEIIKHRAKCVSDAKIKEFIEKNPNIEEHEITKIKERYPIKFYYEEAKILFLELFPKEDEIITYRDISVVRPPLTPLDEDAFDLANIVGKRDIMSEHDFNAQYLQDVNKEKAGYFLEEHEREAMDVDVPEQSLYIIVDTAESLDKAADDRAIGVYGKSTDFSKIDKTILMDGRRGVWDIYGVCKNIIVLALRYPDATILIEGAGGGVSLDVVLRKQILIYNAEAQTKGLPQVSNGVFTFKPDNTKGAKNNRIKLINSPREQGYFLIHVGCDSDFAGQFRKELLAFDPEKNNPEDNCIDTAALSYSREECRPKMLLPPKPDTIKRHSKRNTNGTWGNI